MKKARLEVWVTYDSETGYVWSQVHGSKPNYDERLNAPHKLLRLVSEPYEFDDSRRVSGSFGTEIPVK